MEVSASAYTSYSKYLEGTDASIAAANACTPESMYDITLSASISQSVLNNIPMTSNKGTIYKSNGEELDVLTENYNLSSPIFHLDGEYTDLAWGSYSIDAQVTFDGVTVTSPKQTLHITGLPYKTPSMVEGDWELSSWNCKYSNGAIQLGGVSGSGECTATSKMAFVIPNNVNIKVNTNVTIRAYKFALWYNTDFTVKVNGTQIIKQNSDKQDNNNTGKNYNLSGNATFTPSGCSVVMNSSYTAAGPWSKIHSMEILYR